MRSRTREGWHYPACPASYAGEVHLWERNVTRCAICDQIGNGRYRIDRRFDDYIGRAHSGTALGFRLRPDYVFIGARRQQDAARVDTGDVGVEITCKARNGRAETSCEARNVAAESSLGAKSFNLEPVANTC